MGVIEDRRRIIAAQPHLVTASGSAVLVTIAEPKIERLKVTFSPTQTGSGTPSPSNVRPIYGWGTIMASIGTVPVDISLGGTYYGGTVDLVSGTMTVTHSLVVYDGSSDESWGVENSTAGANFYIKVSDADSEDNLGGSQICNVAATRKSAGWVAGAFFISASKNLNLAIGNLISISTVSEFKTWLTTHNVQLYYKLTTPQTISLSPQTILALRGQQTVTSPAGSVEISYWTH